MRQALRLKVRQGDETIIWRARWTIIWTPNGQMNDYMNGQNQARQRRWGQGRAPMWRKWLHFLCNLCEKLLSTWCEYLVQCLSSHARQASVSTIEIPVSIQRSRQVPGNVRVSWWAEVITSQSTTVLHCCLYPKPTSVTTAFVCGLPTDVLMASYIRWHPSCHKVIVESYLFSNMKMTFMSSRRV